MARIVPAVRGMYIALTLHLLWTLGAAAVITRRQRIPASAAAWLALVFLLPVAGTLLYVLAGYRRAVPAAEPCDCRGDAVEQIVARGCGTRPAPRNSVSLLHNGSNAFTALIAALQHAVRSIHMEYYIIRDDRIGRTIAEILIRKARAGLEVRVIYDAVGSWRLSRTTLRRMHDAGVRTAAFEPVRFPWFTTRVSRRNHRKIVVTDGRIAFLGGINIAKYYLDGDYMGKWRDEHLRIEGDAVKDLQRLFIADWARVTDECLDLRRYVAPHGIRQRLPIQLAWSEEGPSRLTIAEAFAAAVVRARQRVRICSPYFLPPTLILDALRLAARGGIRVEVMIPTCSDSPFSDLVSDSYVADLLDAGVELPLRQRIPARQTGDRRRHAGVGRNREHGLPQSDGQPRSHGLHPRPRDGPAAGGDLRRRPRLVPPHHARRMEAAAVAPDAGRRAPARVTPDVIPS